MASGGLANSKNALMFAGGVIACSALVAMSLGSNFVPGSNNSNAAEARAKAGEDAEDTSNARGTASEDASDEQDDDSVFGDYEEYNSDDDLIDDTSGFDPTPTTEAFASTEPDDFSYADDDYAGEDYSEVVAPQTRSSRTRARPSRPSAATQPRRTNARPKGISVEDMKKRLAQPPVVVDGDEGK